MYQKAAYSPGRILCFRRWSNTAYAIFNSLGKMVTIGHVTSLIEHIATVKSSVSHGISSAFSTAAEDKEPGGDGDLLTNDGGVIEAGFGVFKTAVLLAVSNSSLCGDSAHSIFNSNRYFRPIYGPFLFISQLTKSTNPAKP